MALSLLQLNDVPVALENLKGDSSAILRDLFNCFGNLWIAGIPLHIQNMSNLRIRTNNSCEGIDIHFLYIPI